MNDLNRLNSSSRSTLIDRSAVSHSDERFPKRSRLLRRSEFLGLSRAGKKAYTSHFVVLSKANDKGESRLGVTVSAKVANAVARNRIKRLVREFFRRHACELPSPHDIVVIARKGAGLASLDEVTRELTSAFTAQGSRQR